MASSKLAVSFSCTPVVEIDLSDDDTTPIEAIVEAVAELEGVDPQDLPPFHDVVEPMSLSLLLEHSRRQATSELGVCFTYCGWNVFARGDGTVVIGDPDQLTAPTPLF